MIAVIGALSESSALLGSLNCWPFKHTHTKVQHGYDLTSAGLVVFSLVGTVRVDTDSPLYSIEINENLVVRCRRKACAATDEANPEESVIDIQGVGFQATILRSCPLFSRENSLHRGSSRICEIG